MARPSPLHRARARRGSHAIEFALCMPLWVMAITSIFDLGWLVFHKTSLDAATNEGCRLGALVDPGPWGDDLPLAKAVAEEAALDAVARLTGGPCTTCTFSALVVDSGPTDLRCELVREVEPLAGLVLDTRQVRSVQVAHLQYQY